MADARTAIVLIHGLWMHGVVFAIQRRRLQRLGYQTHAFSYPSVRGDLDEVAATLARQVDALDADRVFLIGHSFGGLVLLTMLARHRLPRVRRAVLLASPCRGSLCATAMFPIPLLGRIVGRPMRQWFDKPLPDPRGMPEIGVVAGDRAIGLARVVFKVPLPNDGVVAVSETRWPWAADMITLRLTHLQMLTSTECIYQTVHFLETGAFDKRWRVGDGKGESLER